MRKNGCKGLYTNEDIIRFTLKYEMLQEKVQEDLKTAQREKDELKTSVLRLLLSAVNYKRIDLGRELSDEDWLGVIQKEIKQRKESIEAYKDSRAELAAKEEKEMKILEEYLPAQMGDEELKVIVTGVVTRLGARDIKDMGKVMAEVKAKVGPSADGARIAAMVRDILGV